MSDDIPRGNSNFLVRPVPRNPKDDPDAFFQHMDMVSRISSSNGSSSNGGTQTRVLNSNKNSDDEISQGINLLVDELSEDFKYGVVASKKVPKQSNLLSIGNSVSSSTFNYYLNLLPTIPEYPRGKRTRFD